MQARTLQAVFVASSNFFGCRGSLRLPGVSLQRFRAQNAQSDLVLPLATDAEKGPVSILCQVPSASRRPAASPASLEYSL